MKKVQEFLKKLWTKGEEQCEDAALMIGDFRDRHPFIYGWVLGMSIVYWSLVIYGIFHPNHKLEWVKKK